MEIKSASALWKDYNPNTLPLNITEIKRLQDERTVTKYVYFSGNSFSEGVTRIFARVVIPLARKNLPAVIIMDEIGTNIVSKNVEDYIREGYVVMLVDYAGDNDISPYHTIYPLEINYATYSKRKSILEEVPAIVTQCCYYEWATVLRRAITYAAALEEVDATRIAVIGSAEGSDPVMKVLATDSRVNCGIIRYGHFNPFLKKVNENDYNSLQYIAGIQPESYAKIIAKPLLMMLCSNEYNNSFDYMVGLAADIKHPDFRLTIATLTNHSFTDSLVINEMLWLKSNFGGEKIFPAMPKVAARSSSGKLYFDIEYDSPDIIVEKKLNYSSNKTPRYRNWVKLNLEQSGEGTYLATTTTFEDTKNIGAYATVIYENGVKLSSLPVLKSPESLGITLVPIVKTRLVYDSDMDTDAWTIINRDRDRNCKIFMAKGPFDIMGVASNASELSTLKIGEEQFRGARDNVLQITLYTPTAAKCAICLTTYDGKQELIYKNIIDLHGESWEKINLQITDFKSEEGYLSSWEKAIMLTIKVAGSFMCSSILWV